MKARARTWVLQQEHGPDGEIEHAVVRNGRQLRNGDSERSARAYVVKRMTPGDRVYIATPEGQRREITDRL